MEIIFLKIRVRKILSKTRPQPSSLVVTLHKNKKVWWLKTNAHTISRISKEAQLRGKVVPNRTYFVPPYLRFLKYPGNIPREGCPKIPSRVGGYSFLPRPGSSTVILCYFCPNISFHTKFHSYWINDTDIGNFLTEIVIQKVSH